MTSTISISSYAVDFLLPGASHLRPPSAAVTINDDGDCSSHKSFDYNVDNFDSSKSGVSMFLISQALESELNSCKQELSPSVSVDNSRKVSCFRLLDCESSDGPVSSQVSGNGGSGINEVMKSLPAFQAEKEALCGGRGHFLDSTIADLSGKISFGMVENVIMREQLGAGGMCLAPAPKMYPHPPVAYP